jgi:hypothetical protein
LLPSSNRRGELWKDHHTVINGILWKLRKGSSSTGFALAKPRIGGMVASFLVIFFYIKRAKWDMDNK